MSTAPPAASARGEAALVAALATFAALRVALCAAAFPFFANVDEQKHVDMVLKYARGYLPEPGHAGYEPQMGELLGVYASPEYLAEPAEIVPPPPWRRARTRRPSSRRPTTRWRAPGCGSAGCSASRERGCSTSCAGSARSPRPRS
jgi:hypothetical protein